MSIAEVEDFFFDDGRDYVPWRKGHSFSQSPCAPIIKIERTSKCLWYSCEIHRTVIHDSLVTLEHHMKYKEPELHKKVILDKLHARETDKSKIIEQQIDDIFDKKEDKVLARARKHYMESLEEKIIGISQSHQNYTSS